MNNSGGNGGAFLPGVSDILDKFDKLHGVGGGSVIRPGEILHLGDDPLGPALDLHQGEVSEGEGVAVLLAGTSDGDGAIEDGGIQIRPVLVAFDPAPLDNRREHDDQRRLLLPDHVPEVKAGAGKRSLGCDIPAIK